MAMKKLQIRLYVPHLKDELTLLQDWTFHLWHESRNEGMGLALGLMKKKKNGEYTYDTWTSDKDEKDIAILPEATVLAVDRIYIRHGGRDYDSITFRIRSSPEKALIKKRFWVKLEDANQLFVETPPQL